MIEYYIIGASGFAKEIYLLTKQCLQKNHIFCGFIDFSPKIKELKVGTQKWPIIDEKEFILTKKNTNNVELFFGVGDPQLLNKLSYTYSDFNFPNLIHPNVHFDFQFNQLGKGNIITNGCAFTVDIQIGNFNVFNLNSTIGHDSMIGNCNVINPGVNVSGSVKIGSNNLLGTNSCVLQGVSIGDNTILGAGSMANKALNSDAVYVGLPAKILTR